MIRGAFVWVSLLVGLAIAFGCTERERPAQPTDKAERSNGALDADPYLPLRIRMVAEQIAGRDVVDPRVLAAMRKVPRHEFVPEPYRAAAYEDHPLPIGHDQTISQPYIVAKMCELAAIKPDDRVLEIGTGSGYHAAVLSLLAKEVFTIEILKPLAEMGENNLKRLGYTNVTVKCGDGYQGWKEHAPFDAIIVTAAPDHIPQPLVEQLKVGGRLVIPVGDRWQELMLITKTEQGVTKKTIFPVRFVPMTGEAQKKK